MNGLFLLHPNSLIVTPLATKVNPINLGHMGITQLLTPKLALILRIDERVTKGGQGVRSKHIIVKSQDYQYRTPFSCVTM